jgi:hypothetical protein
MEITCVPYPCPLIPATPGAAIRTLVYVRTQSSAASCRACRTLPIPLENIHARYIRDAFFTTARALSTTGCRTGGMLGQNVRQRLGELAIKCRNVCAATHDLSQTRQTVAVLSLV